MNESIEKTRYEVVEVAPGAFRVWDNQTDYYATSQVCTSREQAEAAMAGCLWYRVRRPTMSQASDKLAAAILDSRRREYDLQLELERRRAQMWLGPPREVCKHCGKELEEFGDLGCEHCDARHPDYGVIS